MRTNSVLILVVAIVLGGFAAFLARSWLLSRTEASTGNGTIVVASKRMTFGTPITDDSIEVVKWAAPTLPRGAFLSKDALFKGGRRTTLATIEQGEPILNSKITGPGQRASLSTLIDKDKRAVTIRVDDVRGVAGFILPNDRVDVVLIRSRADSSGRKDYSDLLLQDVKVIAVDQIAAEQKEHPIVAKAVTLEVTPQQAQKISLAANVGRLSLILRKAGDSDVVSDLRVTESDLAVGDEPPPPAPVVSQPVKKEPPPAPKVRDVTVSIIRNLKAEDYKVVRELR